MAKDAPVRAAQYVRMSKENQIYSTGHQLAGIARYADDRGFEIVRTYEDNGRSGLRLKGRTGLQQLLTDVLSGTAGYDAILVYDISRWGRFQDVDESAHYEFLCRQAGLVVHYIGETFENDGSLISGLSKSLKRYMAGEFSRELSRKIWTSQARHAALGFRMGGRTPYGVRRQLLDDYGSAKMQLAPGEVKNIRSEKVVLVPGPPEELDIIRRIYRLSIRSQLHDGEIASVLNEEGLPAVGGSPWSKYLVRQILTSELYLGTALFNRVSHKMGGLPVRNPPEQWIRRSAMFPPIISLRTFRAAQRCRHKRRSFRLTEPELLGPLRNLLAAEGRLSLPLITKTPGMPNPASYRRRYGSLDAAYAKVGYIRPIRRTCPPSERVVDRLSALTVQVLGSIERSGLKVRRDAVTGLLRIDGKCSLAVALSRYHAGVRDHFWEFRLRRDQDVYLVLAGLLAPDDRTIQAYYLIPAARFPAAGKIRIVAGGHRLERFRLPDLTGLGDRLWAEIRARDIPAL